MILWPIYRVSQNLTDKIGGIAEWTPTFSDVELMVYRFKIQHNIIKCVKGQHTTD